MGSVKDTIILEPAGQKNVGRARFVFSDRYSVFDWGSMPNLIPHKGEALCLIGAYFFELLEARGISTHYLGVIDANGNVCRLDELDKPTNRMEYQLLRVLQPKLTPDGKYDYSVYKRERANFLIPLEVIYRNYISEGSSLLKRLRTGNCTLLEALGLTPSKLKVGSRLQPPLIEFSTKLESADRYLTPTEAIAIADLTPDELDTLKSLTLEINKIISSRTEAVGLINEDGKIEFGFDLNRKLIVTDVCGTPDECRFRTATDDSFGGGGIEVSKELLRKFYRRTDWYKTVEKLKHESTLDWKSKSQPPPEAPPELIEKVSLLYQACANALTGRTWFEGVPSIQHIAQALKELTGVA